MSGPAGAAFFQLVFRSSVDNAPVAGTVASLRLKGATTAISAVSDAGGITTFGLRAPAVEDAVLLVEPGFGGHWGYFNRKVTLNSGDVVLLDPVDLAVGPDALRHLMRTGQPGDGAGVTVAVIDTGVGPHPDLPNTVGDADTSLGHGTHVAGIIAGGGTAANPGVAPGAAIRSYRVFPDPATGVAKNFDIHKAIEAAVSDGCHIINLSLKVERQLDPQFNDVVISTALEDAADAGVLVVAAAGNDFRRFVAFPARHPDVISVAAVGWEPGLPASAYDRWTVSRDRGVPDGDIFFASFSNEGVNDTAIDVAAPGAGIISTVPVDRYAPMSGTSMACPAAVGAIARLLSAHPAVIAMPPDRARRDAIWALAAGQLSPLGLGNAREGSGMIR
jgi:subtilisin